MILLSVSICTGCGARGREGRSAAPVPHHLFSVRPSEEEVVMARSGSSRMKKPACDYCKRYLDHLKEKNQNMSCFLRCMTANSKHSMVVPNRFLKHFTGKLSGTIKLESPNGSLYDVKVTERFNKVVFQHGWGEFVDAHHVEENDYLLFRHIEKSCFEALIFDSDGYEKVFSCAGIRNTPIFQEKKVDSVDISSSYHHETTESLASERFVRCQKGNSCHRGKTAKMSVTSSFEESGKDIPSENEYFESEDLQTPTRADYVLSLKSYLSKAQEERVIALIQEILPESTVLVVVMKKSHVEPPGAYLAIHKGYALEHFPHESTNVTLKRPGKSKKWHPKFCKRKTRSVYVLTGQWLDFVRDNHVKVGDICLFFPTKGGRRFTLTVYLHRTRAIRSRGGSGFQRASSCHGEDVSSASETGMHKSSHESLASDSSGPSEPPYIVPAKSCLSRSQRKIVEERVQAIQSEVPIFVAIMNKSHVGVNRYGLIELGALFAVPHLPHSGQTVVLQCMRRTWKTSMKITTDSSGRRRWFLTGGWPTFVRENDLRIGDICLFELKKNEGGLTMKVHIISRDQF